MPNFLDKLLVKTPAYNIFPVHDIHNKLNMPIGRNVPVKWIELHAGEEVDVNMTQLTRLMPLTNPIFHRVNLEFIPFFVPFRLLDEFGFDGENYFNPATLDSERVPMPMIHPYKLYKGIDRILNSIWDYLRYPTFSWLLREFLNDEAGHYNIYAMTSPDASTKETSYVYEQLYSYVEGTKNGVWVDYVNNSDTVVFSVILYRFPVYVIREWLKTQGLVDEQIDVVTTPAAGYAAYSSPYDKVQNADLSLNWDVIYSSTGKRPQQFYDEYLNYLHLEFVKAYLDVYKDREDEEFSLLPWLCYCRLIYDWFINTGVTDVSNLPKAISQIVQDVSDGRLFAESLYYDFSDVNGDRALSNFFPWLSDATVGSEKYSAFPARSLWQRDYFTGAFVSSQQGDAVPIPANGTIPDLAGARKLQWFKTLNLFGGKRFIDQIFAHRGVKSSDARLDRCEVIGEKKSFRLQISDVLQTSQSDIDSVLGSYAGHAISYAGDHLLHYRAEEPGLVIVIGRCRPTLEYMEVTPRLLLKSDFYDFENPEFDNVGMQPIYQKELDYRINPDSQNQVFAWTRRFAEYMTDSSEIHGDFKTSLANWHMARSFNTGYAQFNTNFSVIRDRDDLNRIFANPQYPNSILMDLTFDIQVSRPLSKVVEFDF